MPQGLQLFDASGSIVLDTSTRLTRIYGTYTIPPQGGAASGSIIMPDEGSPYFWYVFGDWNANRHSITLSGHTLNWSVGAATTDPLIVVYGAY